MTPRFGRVLTAMVTPFDDEGALDLGAAAELAQFLVETGSEGLVLAGTTGESPVLTDSEAAALFRRVRESVDVPLIGGAGSNSTTHAVELTRMAADAGMDAILTVTPYYNRPPQAGLLHHFSAVAAATELPVLIYDIPIRTGRKVSTETLLELATGVENIVGVKDAAKDVMESARLMAGAPEGFELYSGDDSMTLPLLSVGAVGVVGVASHWAATQMGEMVAAYSKGDAATAQRINAELVESFAFETSDDAPNPIPTKAMMRVLGLRVGRCRAPMVGEPDDLEARARKVIEGLG